MERLKAGEELLVESKHFVGIIVLQDGNVKESLELHIGRGDGGIVCFLELIPELLGSGACLETCLKAALDFETHGLEGLVIKVDLVVHLLGHVNNDLLPIFVVDVIGVIKVNDGPAPNVHEVGFHFHGP